MGEVTDKTSNIILPSLCGADMDIFNSNSDHEQDDDL